MLHDSPARFQPTNSQEEALHTFCKQKVKSKLFKGFYKERCYIDEVKGYRDLIILNRDEKELSAILEEVRNRLVQFYQALQIPVWVGLTAAPNPLSNAVSNICIWTELDELAFDQYWFSVKGMRFRNNEIIIKLKPVRAVELEQSSTVRPSGDAIQESPTIGLQDFLEVLIGWGTSIKRTAYEFMSNDISKDNFKAVIKCLSLLTISLLSASVHVIRFIGIFTIRFTIELRRLLIVTTPIFMRLIDLCGKVIGGFYILIAMIWRDATGAKNRQANQHEAIAYNRPVYQRLKYERNLRPQT